MDVYFLFDEFGYFSSYPQSTIGIILKVSYTLKLIPTNTLGLFETLAGLRSPCVVVPRVSECALKSCGFRQTQLLALTEVNSSTVPVC